MENGIDLNEIPGEKAGKGERIQGNFPKKNRYSPRRNNDFVDVEPIRNVQQFIDRLQKPRVHVPEIHKPPKHFQRDPLIPAYHSDNRLGMFERLFTGLLVLLFWAIVIAIVGGALYLGAIALDALFTFVSEFANDIFDFVSSALAFLWECVKIIFWIYVILIVLSLFD